jgi:hypothetical protein
MGITTTSVVPLYVVPLYVAPFPPFPPFPPPKTDGTPVFPRSSATTVKDVRPL